MPKEHYSTARIEARFAADALAVVKRAAELQGRSISDFVVAAAQEAAHKTIEEAHLIRLSIEDQQRFVELLLNPATVACVETGEKSAFPAHPRFAVMRVPFLVESLRSSRMLGAISARNTRRLPRPRIDDSLWRLTHGIVYIRIEWAKIHSNAQGSITSYIGLIHHKRFISWFLQRSICHLIDSGK